MKPPQCFFLVLVIFLLSAIASAAVAKPIDSSISHDRTLATRDPINSIPHGIPHYRLTKRARSTSLPGGWEAIFHADLQAFNHIPSAATTLAAFYKWAFDDLGNAEYANVRTRTLSITDGPFELVFRHRDPTTAVSLIMVRAFVGVMLNRVQLGWVTKYAGTIEGPGGVAVDMILNIVGPVSATILDSAMDMYGY
ncbi:MAG: hypothetical protein Q9208_004753 [Pyrenodesmia sp. 3 TL-2023]